MKIGDMDGGGQPDIVVGASQYYETGPTTNSSCDPGPCSFSGRAYFYRGEDVARSDPSSILDQPFKVLKNPMAQSDDPAAPATTYLEVFAHSVAPIGDVGSCGIDPGPGAMCIPANGSIIPDGRPDVVLSAHWTDFPAGFFDAGVVYLVDGSTGSILHRYEHPQPQRAAFFGFTLGNQPAIGDVGNTAAPDVYLPAYVQHLNFAGQGRGYVMNGNFKTRTDLAVLSLLDDPTPNPGGNFGVVSAGIGDVAGDPRNEILVGEWGPVSPGDDQSIVSDVHVFSPVAQKALLTLDDPDRQPRSSFGSGVAPMGDLNDDGHIDFAVGAGAHSGEVGLN